MNTPNPLVPQGTAPAGGKSTVRIVVLGILVVHVALIGGMLIQGCSKETPKTATDDPTATAMMSTNEPYYPTETNVLPVAGTEAVASVASPSLSNVPPLGVAPVAPVATPIATPIAPVAPVAPVALPATTGSEYTVVAKDTLATIASSHHISLKALQAANPGVDPRKLRVGQKLQLPAPSAPAASAVAPAAVESVSSSATSVETSVYTVKAGDALGRIAKTHHTTVKAITALNNLKSPNIRVGQKLKMPAPKKAATPAPAAPAVTEPAPISTAAAPAASPFVPTAAAN